MSIESLLFDLNTIKAATDDFADSNKLGEGGFGPVYKVIVCLKLSKLTSWTILKLKPLHSMETCPSSVRHPGADRVILIVHILFF